jgi:thiamine-phosphate pyrophosphorylase
MENFGIYIIITNPTLPYSTIAEICVRNEIKMLQLREKNLDDRSLIRIGREIKSITKGSETRFVMNDRPDLAVLCDADVLHLGQDDMPFEEARKIVGDMPIGLSTHSIEQAKRALELNPMYIGFGPIFPTNAKAKPDAPVGTEKLSEVLQFAQVPVVAIGGLFPENIEQVVKAGAQNIALVRHFMQTSDLEARIEEMNHHLKQRK